VERMTFLRPIIKIVYVCSILRISPLAPIECLHVSYKAKDVFGLKDRNKKEK